MPKRIRSVQSHSVFPTLLLILVAIIFSVLYFYIISKGSASSHASSLQDNSVVNVFGNATQFDGQTGIVQVMNSASMNPKFGYTVEAWYKPTIEQNQILDRSETLLNKIALNDESYLLNTNISSTDGVKFDITYFFVVNNAAAGCHSDQSFSISRRKLSYDQATAWQHIAGVIQNDGKLKIYVNGNTDPNALGTIGGTCNSNSLVHIGALSFGTRRGFATGVVDEVRISDIARYSSDFAPPTVPFTSDNNTVLLYHLNESSPSRATVDSSQFKRDGVLKGGVDFVSSSVPNPFMKPEKLPY